MLGEGQRRKARGGDVVIALLETHARLQTAAAAEGLEVVPRMSVDYRGGSFGEMDVEAVVARHPELALVDELAHTNIPGSANEKRWQDVVALLNAGINVITTVNIQHLESVNDVVERITGVPVPLRVPRLITCMPAKSRANLSRSSGAAVLAKTPAKIVLWSLVASIAACRATASASRSTSFD